MRKLLTPQNSTKMLRNLTFLVQFGYFCFIPKKKKESNFRYRKSNILLFLSTFWATFWEVTGNVLRNLRPFVRGCVWIFFYFLKTFLWKITSSNLFENQFRFFTTGNIPSCKYVLFKSQMFQTKQHWTNTRRMTDDVGTRRNKWTPWDIRIHILWQLYDIYIYSTFQSLAFTKQLFNISIDRWLILLNVKENETHYKKK